MQPRMLLGFVATMLCCWFMVNLSLHQHPQGRFCKVISSCSAYSLYWCMVLSLTDAGVCICLCWTKVPIDSFSPPQNGCRINRCNNYKSKFFIIYRLVERMLCPSVQAVSEDPNSISPNLPHSPFSLSHVNMPNFKSWPEYHPSSSQDWQGCDLATEYFMTRTNWAALTQTVKGF